VYRLFVAFAYDLVLLDFLEYRVSSSLRFAYRLGRRYIKFRFMYHLVFVSRNKLPQSSRVALIVQLIIVDGLSRDSAIPELTPSSQHSNI